MEKYEKLKLSLRYFLLGKGFYKTVEAIDFANFYHSGLRKNGSQEFEHQIQISHYLRTLLQNFTK